MFWPKSCPKCHGDLRRGTDIHGSYVTCAQCSRYLNAQEEEALLHTASIRVPEAATAA